MAFADLTAKLRLNIADFSSNLTQASRLMRRFAHTMNRQYGDAARSLTVHNMGLKDTNRIVQGIVVAQTFYGGARAIREATNAVWGFNEALDYATVTYSALFGSTDLANKFMLALKEHSIETIFDYEQLAESSKKLLAYGIDYKNLMFIMEGLTNLGAMSGDAAALDRISLALGQIYTRGKLTAEEMRQLANAYVPIAEIVQERFNLTPDQMGKIGDLNLPAHEVINAVVDYANERFGEVGDAAMFTMTGLKNKIVDTFKVMSVEMMQPFNRVFKSFLVYVAKGLEGIRQAYATGGAGGLFEHLVPDKNAQVILRQFLANVRNIFMSFMSFGVVAGQVIRNFGQVFVTAFNIISPVITIFTNAILKSLNAMMSTRAGATILRIALLGAASAFIALRVHAIGALVITTVTKAVMGLSKALLLLAGLVTRHPILMLLAGLVTVLAGVSLASSSANNSISSLFDTLTAAGGASGADMLPVVNKELEDASDAASEFDDRLTGSADAADALADGLNKAGKNAKKTGDLLSFDEVFRLKEETDSGSGSGVGSIGDAIGNLTDGLGGLGSALIPDIPDFSEFIKGFTDGLFGGLKDSLLGNLTLAGLGAMLGYKILKGLEDVKITSKNASVIKFAKNLTSAMLGAFIGLGLGALMGTFTDKLWEALEEQLKLTEGSTEQASIGATIGSVIGGAIGMLVGGLPGSLIGTAIGHLAGGIVGLAWDEIKTVAWNSITGLGAGIAGALAKAWGGSFTEVVKLIDFTSVGTMFKSIGGIFKGAGIKAITKGGVIGLAIGLVVDGIAALLWKGLKEKFNLSESSTETAAIGQTIGGVIGTILGGLLGGPAGAVIGGAIGTFAGGLVGLFWDKIVEFFSNPNILTGATYGTAIGGAIGAAFGPIGAMVGVALGNIAGIVVGHFWDDITEGLSNWWKDIKELFSGWLDELKTNVEEWWKERLTDIGSKGAEYALKITSWLAGLVVSWTNAYNEIKLNIEKWWTNLKTTFATKSYEILSNLSSWWNETKTKWSTKYGEIAGNISTWWSETKTAFLTKTTEILGNLNTWWDDTKTKWSTKYGEIKATASTKWDEIKTTFTTKTAEILGNLGTWWDETKTKWSTKYSDIKTSIGTWWDGFSSVYVTKTAEILGKLVGWWNETKTTWSTKYGEIKTALMLWFAGLITDVKLWWDNLWDTSGWTSGWEHIKSWFTDMLTAIGEWFTNIKTNIGDWWSGLWKNLKTPDIGGGSFSVGNIFKIGHATGGIFDREHVARFAEGNKAEAIIPLENSRAMQPFVDAVANGLVGTLAPIIAGSGGGGGTNQLPPMYVGTLVADERGLKQLYKKFEVIKVQEDARRGIVTE